MRTTNRTYRTVAPEDLSPRGFWVMLDGVEDPYNFGYSVRSLYAAGVDGILLPERNWMTAAGTVARSSAGTSEKIDIRIVSSPEVSVSVFRSAGYRILAAEIKNSESLYHTDLQLPLMFIIGGEKRGISGSLLELADIRVKIEYANEFRASLSAASATTMFAYEIMRQNKK
jgi:23S rRNA (guanosine2251-2'-O)-methyltransferase